MKSSVTSGSKQQRGKLENIVTLQMFYLLIYLEQVNLKLKIMRTRLQIPNEKLKLDKVVKRTTNQLVNLSYCFWIIYTKTQTIKCMLNLAIFGFTFSIFPIIIIRCPLGYLFFITPRFENKGKWCQDFQAFLHILKTMVYRNSVTERKTPIFNPIGCCFIFEEY